jgi:hypothetical protein
LWHQ